MTWWRTSVVFWRQYSDPHRHRTALIWTSLCCMLFCSVLCYLNHSKSQFCRLQGNLITNSLVHNNCSIKLLTEWLYDIKNILLKKFLMKSNYHLMQIWNFIPFYPTIVFLYLSFGLHRYNSTKLSMIRAQIKVISYHIFILTTSTYFKNTTLK